MVGIKKIKIILGISIPFFAIFIMSQNTFAVTKGYNSFRLTYNTPQSSTFVSTDPLAYDSVKFNIHSVKAVSAKVTGSDSVPSNSNFMSVTAKYNLLTWTDNGSINYLPSFVNNPIVSTVTINDNPVNFDNSDTSVYITNFVCDPVGAGISTNCRTFTFEYSFIVRNLPTTINSMAAAISWDDNIFLNSGYVNGYNAYFEYDPNNKLVFDFSYDYTSALLSQQTQLQTITNNNLTEINDSINNHYNQEQDSIDNIDNQSSSDIQGAENQQTTNLIGFLTDFIDTLRGRGTTSSCNISLPFPQFLGGNKTVNVCTGRGYLEMSGSNYISAFSRLFIICFFVPLIWILLKLIYNEIRSWTNG